MQPLIKSVSHNPVIERAKSEKDLRKSRSLENSDKIKELIKQPLDVSQQYINSYTIAPCWILQPDLTFTLPDHLENRISIHSEELKYILLEETTKKHITDKLNTLFYESISLSIKCDSPKCSNPERMHKALPVLKNVFKEFILDPIHLVRDRPDGNHPVNTHDAFKVHVEVTSFSETWLESFLQDAHQMKTDKAKKK